ncbi:MAG: hypothetical protein HPY50_01690 [Firmicutes bacterium]|nr:hypothetical protein [Bacillota bacterium]
MLYIALVSAFIISTILCCAFFMGAAQMREQFENAARPGGSAPADQFPAQ